MFLENNPLRHVAVDDVHGEVENLGPEPELLVDLNEKLGEKGPHVPLELGLHVHQINLRQGRLLEEQNERVSHQSIGRVGAIGATSLTRRHEGGRTSMTCMYAVASSRYSSSNNMRYSDGSAAPTEPMAAVWTTTATAALAFLTEAAFLSARGGELRREVWVAGCCDREDEATAEVTV